MAFLHTPTRSFPRRPFTDPISSAIVDMKDMWRAHRAQRKLNNLSDHLRRDIGMTTERRGRDESWRMYRTTGW